MAITECIISVQVQFSQFFHAHYLINSHAFTDLTPFLSEFYYRIHTDHLLLWLAIILFIFWYHARVWQFSIQQSCFHWFFWSQLSLHAWYTRPENVGDFGRILSFTSLLWLNFGPKVSTIDLSKRGMKPRLPPLSDIFLRFQRRLIHFVLVWINAPKFDLISKQVRKICEMHYCDHLQSGLCHRFSLTSKTLADDSKDRN